MRLNSPPDLDYALAGNVDQLSTLAPSDRGFQRTCRNASSSDSIGRLKLADARRSTRSVFTLIRGPTVDASTPVAPTLPGFSRIERARLLPALFGL
jgi:hypothetical protein